MFAVPQLAVVFAGGLVQSVAVQQPAVATHLVVPVQFLKPELQLMLHNPVAAVHTAIPFEGGVAQALHDGPQNVVLVSD